MLPALGVAVLTSPPLPAGAEGLASVGLSTEGVGFAHGLHTPYWVLRSIVGLPRADRSRLVRAFRLYLIRATASRFMDWLERRVVNFVCPKSLILYAEKRVVGTDG